MNGQKKWTPCSPADPDPSRRECGIMDIETEELLPPIAGIDDFMKALQASKKSVGPEDLKKQEEWTESYGVEG